MSKKILYSIAGLIMLAALGGAAWTAIRLLQPENSNGGNAIVSSDGKAMSSVNFEGAKELPTEKPAVDGPISKINDNILTMKMLDTSQGVTVVSDESGKITVEGADSAPEIEVVIQKETKIYKDTTFENENAAEMNGTIQQTVAEITADDITTNGLATVWGHKRGDRILAEIILFNGF